MGRKRIIDQDSYKFSMDLSGDNKVAIDRISSNYNLKYGPFFNMLVKTICRMAPKIRESFIDFCIAKCDEINNQIVGAGENEAKILNAEKNQYLEIAQLLNDGIPVSYDNTDPCLRKIPVKNGLLVIPKEWILLNQEDAENCLYAVVVECRNAAKYKIPHFVYFSLRKYDVSMSDYINELCCEKWPGFHDVIKAQVTLIPDPEHKGEYLNAQEHLASPVIGYFDILATDDELFDDDPPYGAVIVRTNTPKTDDEKNF